MNADLINEGNLGLIKASINIGYTNIKDDLKQGWVEGVIQANSFIKSCKAHIAKTSCLSLTCVSRNTKSIT